MRIGHNFWMFLRDVFQVFNPVPMDKRLVRDYDEMQSKTPTGALCFLFHIVIFCVNGSICYDSDSTMNILLNLE